MGNRTSKAPAVAPVVDVVELKQQHEALERQLAALERHLSLTPAEEVERARLKKEKLRLKDRLFALTAAARPARST